MFKNVTKWLGVVDNTHDEEVSVNAEGEEKIVAKSGDNDDAEKKEVKNDQESKENPENDDLISPQTKQTLEDVSAKAINTAKEWGCMQSCFFVHLKLFGLSSFFCHFFRPLC